jgi:hypothetical protein
MRSASEWQQQERQHWLAVRQPQLEVSHGNSSLLFPDSLSLVPAGSGMPAAVIMNAPSSAMQMLRR